MILYGAIVESAHSHGFLLSDAKNVASFTDGGGAQSSADGYARQKDCSTCQFQRQLVDGLVHATLFVGIPVIEYRVDPSLTISYRSTSTTPRSGRAPPFGRA